MILPGQHGDAEPGFEPAAELMEAVLELRDHPQRLERAARLIAAEGNRRLPFCETVVSIILGRRRNELRVVGGAGPWAERLVGHVWQLDGMPAAATAALMGDEPVDLIEPTSSFPFLAELPNADIRSGRLIPLSLDPPRPGSSIAGAAISFWSRRRASFTARERQAGDALGRLATLLLGQVEAWLAADRSAERLLLRKAIAEDVQSSLEPLRVVESTVGHLLEIAAADRVTLSVIEGDYLRILSSRDRERDPGWSEMRIPMIRILQNPVTAQVVARRQPYRGGPFQLAPGSAMSAFSDELQQARHTALVPLVIRSEVTGLIALTRRDEPEFSDDEIVELEIGASVAALALRNALLHQQTNAVASAQRAFLNLAAHELRTPFTVISGYLSMLVDGTFGPPPAPWLQPLAAMRTKTEELGYLVEQMLQASRTEGARVALRLESTRLAGIVKSAVERLTPRLELHGGTARLDAKVDPMVRADPSTLAIILDNLLNNAVTYRRGPPRIELRLDRAADTGRPEAVLRVRDHGLGIPARDIDRVFERFQRVPLSGEATPAGAGLGLFIARQLAEDLGGTLAIDWSAPGEGSEFSLRLPLEDEEPLALPEDGLHAGTEAEVAGAVHVAGRARPHAAESISSSISRG